MSDLPTNPLVTFALFSYNQEAFIESAIQSALAQDYSPLEIIISDDFSRDSTYEIMKLCAASYCGPHKVTVRRNEQNLGLANHINALLELANGEFVCWAAGDDISHKQKVSALVAPMIADPSVTGTHSYLNEIDANGDFVCVRRPAVPETIFSASQVIEDEIEVISQSHAFRKKVWDRFGGIQSWVTNESAVMAFREACCGRIILVPEVYTDYRIGVGVSTQRGRTVHELSTAEPTKYARWWATGFRQISIDSERAELSDELNKLIAKKSRAFDERLAVNQYPWQIGTLLKNAFRPGFGALLKAFLRRNTPAVLLEKLYKYRGWL